MVFPVRNAVLCFGLALFFAGRSTSAQSGAVEDSCSDVLRFGLHGIYSSMREPTLEAAMKWWACGADERSVVQALNTTATGALTDFPVGAWIERSVLRGWRTQKCPSGTGLFASRDFEQVAYRVLSSYPGDTIPAWTSCRTARRNPRLSSRIVTYPDALGHYGLMVHIAASPRPAPSPETGNPISFFDTTLASPARPILGQVRPLPPPPSPGCRYVHPGFASAGGMMQFFFCERPSPARVELKMTTSFGQLLPAPTLPALPTGPTCPSPGGGGEYHTDTASDPVNCGTCGLSCGDDGKCQRGLCTQCVFELAGMALTPGASNAPRSTCRMAAGKVAVVVVADISVRPGRYPDKCASETEVELQLRIDDTRRTTGRGLYSNPQDATCEGAASVRLMGETVIGGSESVGATLEALECRHDGRFSPCVVRSGQLTFTSVATPASPPVRRRRK